MAKRSKAFTIDAETQKLLEELADREFDGNESMAIRRLIRNAAKAETLHIPLLGTLTGKGDEIGNMLKLTSKKGK